MAKHIFQCNMILQKSLRNRDWTVIYKHGKYDIYKHGKSTVKNGLFTDRRVGVPVSSYCLGHISVYTTNVMWSNSFLTYECGLNDHFVFCAAHLWLDHSRQMMLIGIMGACIFYLKSLNSYKKRIFKCPTIQYSFVSCCLIFHKSVVILQVYSVAVSIHNRKQEMVSQEETVRQMYVTVNTPKF